MQSKAATVEQYLAELPPDRREALSAVRKVILANLDKDYQECMQYGMIGYSVPHSVFPAGYHCDPRQPLPFAGMASQKGHMSLYLMCVYGDTAHARWFATAWKKTGKKLDMGKACVRFKRIEDVALDVVGEAIRRLPAAKYIAYYTSLLGKNGKPVSARKAAAEKASAKKAPANKAPAKKKTGKVAKKKAAGRSR